MKKQILRPMVLSVSVILFALFLAIQGVTIHNDAQKEAQQIIENGGSGVDLLDPGLAVAMLVFIVYPIEILVFDVAFTLIASFWKYGKGALQRTSMLIFTAIELFFVLALIVYYKNPDFFSTWNIDLEPITIFLHLASILSAIAKHFAIFFSWVREKSHKGARKELQKELQAE